MQEEQDNGPSEEIVINLEFPNQNIAIDVELDPALSRNQAVIDYFIGDEEEEEDSTDDTNSSGTLISIVEPEEPEEQEPAEKADPIHITFSPDEVQTDPNADEKNEDEPEEEEEPEENEEEEDPEDKDEEKPEL